MYEQQIERLAELIVGFGANVQEGQIVTVGADLGKEALVREITASAYRHGASFVEVTYVDPFIARARLLNAKPETLGAYPDWQAHRMLQLGEQRVARVSLTGATEPHLLDDIDPLLIGQLRGPSKESGEVMNARTTNWVIGPSPTPDWALLVHPEIRDPQERLTKLWDEITYVCRLDEDDPVAAWGRRMETLRGVTERLDARRFDALHFTGPGTDLTVGLLPSSFFQSIAVFETVDGIVHAPNVPSEEVFTTPDPLRTNGVVRSTKPLFTSGSVIEGLEVEFRGGRVVRIDADKNADVLRALVTRDEGALQLGEVALVDGEGRIGPLGTVFYDTLLDENAASHIALGRGFDFAVRDEADIARVNHSEIHIDFMIGSDDVSVAGVAADGTESPVLVGGAWQL